MSVGVTAGSRGISWNWRDVQEQALELAAACKSEMRWNSFKGGQTTYKNEIVIKLEYNAGHSLAQSTSAGGGLDLS